MKLIKCHNINEIGVNHKERGSMNNESMKLAWKIEEANI